MRVNDWLRKRAFCTQNRSLEIGKVVQHPDGRYVLITRGQYLGLFGISNFWYWREVLEDEELGKEECGYGWDLNRENERSYTKP